MSATLTGDFAKLQELITRLKQVASGKQLVRVSDALAAESALLIEEGFSARRDPYGVNWEPLAPSTRNYAGTILERTGQLRRQWFRTVQRSGFSLVNSRKQAPIHQRGARYRRWGKTIRLPARQMVPDSAKGAGLWGPRLKNVAIREVLRILRGR